MDLGSWHIQSQIQNIQLWSSPNKVMVEFNDRKIAEFLLLPGNKLRVDSQSCTLVIEETEKNIFVTPR